MVESTAGPMRATERLGYPVGRLRRGRDVVLGLADVAAWTLALALAVWMRYDFSWAEVNGGGLVTIIALAGALQLIVGLATGLYLGRWQVASFVEIICSAFTVGVVSALLVVVVLLSGPTRWVPISVPALAGLTAIVVMGTVRCGWRVMVDRRLRPQGDHLRRMVVFGAGEAGEQVIRLMMRTPASTYLPVALLDDDRSKRRRKLHGVAVEGDRHALAQVAMTHGADTLLIAIPSASARLVRELSELAEAAGLDVKVLPSVSEVIGGHLAISDIRDLTEADLLGRHRVETDVPSIAGYLRGKRVLVTGAGGSIGSELCRQIARYEPANLIMVDRDESALHSVQLSIEGRAMLDSADLVLLDLRDRAGVLRLFEARRPEVVFHAAALKHLPLLERHPGEAVKSNVWVTDALLDAADRTGVDRFVNVSTDKAADPTSVLGYSKRVAERLTAAYAAAAEGTFMSVRFGNVLGSRGSVLGAFRAQIEAGGPVTVTHPDVTRYFMTVEEAVELVIQAGAIGDPGEALVLDMGAPVRIDEVARRLIHESKRDIEIVYTGLRKGEKLHEALFSADEVDRRPVHPMISHVEVPALEAGAVQMLDPAIDCDELVEDLRTLCVALVDDAAVLDLNAGRFVTDHDVQSA